MVTNPQQVRRWRNYLADELAEAAVYRRLAERRQGVERDILRQLAEAEERHAAHWQALLPKTVETSTSARSLGTRLIAWLARRFGFVVALAMAERREAKSPYQHDPDVPAAIRADEQIHAEVIRSLAALGRSKLSGTFRAGIFGANDGLVSNFALVLGIGASGVSANVVLITGFAGLLAGALSMGTGEWVSVRAQLALLKAGHPNLAARQAVTQLDVNANELALVYRSQGLDLDQAQAKAEAVLAGLANFADDVPIQSTEQVGTPWGVALASFCFFAVGAVIPVLPFAVGLSGLVGMAWSAGLVGIALMLTGSCVGLISGTSPLSHGVRQLAIGFGAAGVTYLIGWLLGVAVS
ncbi:MAG: VIT1/CCC1 family protein [Bifidobacteriaceae bacterium]|jgi:VIT1/CCC1 family predicted Fe2+/Mn2+ transporter|nr:VIT1/CCC1 family protein [Bifidobacteriaceae bacterium]